MPDKPKSCNFIQVEQDAWFTHIHISRPERHNALGPSLLAELQTVTDGLMKKQTIKNDDQIDILFVTTETTKQKSVSRPLWIAGGDLKELGNLSKVEGQAFFANMRSLRRTWRQAPFLVVSFVDGLAIGGGAEFALYADFRLMSDQGALLFKQMDIGLPLGFFGSEALTELVGLGQTQRLLFSNEVLMASECLELGLAHKLLNGSDLGEIKQWLKQRFGHYSAVALQAQKQMLYPSSVDNSIDGRELTLFFKAWRNPLHDSILKKFDRSN